MNQFGHGVVRDAPQEAPKNAHYPRWVDMKQKEKCPHCIAKPQQDRKIKPEIDPDCPFCKGTGMAARKMIVQNPSHHASIVGYAVTEEGKPVNAEAVEDVI